MQLKYLVICLTIVSLHAADAVRKKSDESASLARYRRITEAIDAISPKDMARRAEVLGVELSVLEQAATYYKIKHKLGFEKASRAAIVTAAQDYEARKEAHRIDSHTDAAQARYRSIVAEIDAISPKDMADRAVTLGVELSVLEQAATYYKLKHKLGFKTASRDAIFAAAQHYNARNQRNRARARTAEVKDRHNESGKVRYKKVAEEIDAILPDEMARRAIELRVELSVLQQAATYYKFKGLFGFKTDPKENILFAAQNYAIFKDKLNASRRAAAAASRSKKGVNAAP